MFANSHPTHTPCCRVMQAATALSGARASTTNPSLPPCQPQSLGLSTRVSEPPAGQKRLRAAERASAGVTASARYDAALRSRFTNPTNAPLASVRRMRRNWTEVIPPTLARWRIAARCSGELSWFRAFAVLPLHISPQKEQGQHQRCLSRGATPLHLVPPPPVPPMGCPPGRDAGRNHKSKAAELLDEGCWQGAR